MKVLVFGNIIADILMAVEKFPIDAQDLQEVSHLDAGPGGACNVAIMAARFGLEVFNLGEVGDDPFGRLILSGLEREGININLVQVNPASQTPVAGVLIDAKKEPAYLGFPGSLQMRSMPQTWLDMLPNAEALFVDGWIEYDHWAGLVLEAMERSRAGGTAIFFDPGPGNPRQDNDWHQNAAALSSVILANEQEICRLAGLNEPAEAARALIDHGCQLVVVKRGARGCLIISKEETIDIPGLAVEAIDQTGAGDSLAGAVIFAYLHGFSLKHLGQLANATGAAKVQKIGTGHQVPTLDEIRAVLNRFGSAGDFSLRSK